MKYMLLHNAIEKISKIRNLIDKFLIYEETIIQGSKIKKKQPRFKDINTHELTKNSIKYLNKQLPKYINRELKAIQFLNGVLYNSDNINHYNFYNNLNSSDKSILKNAHEQILSVCFQLKNQIEEQLS